MSKTDGQSQEQREPPPEPPEVVKAKGEIDRQIAEKLFDWTDFAWRPWPQGWRGIRPGEDREAHVDRYSSDIGSTWKVVECLHELGYDVDILVPAGPLYHCFIWPRGGPQPEEATLSAQTAPLAICCAAIRALGSGD